MWRLSNSQPPQVVAEREGFEPSFPCGKHALQACALDQTTRSLREKSLRFSLHSEAHYTIKGTLPFLVEASPVQFQLNYPLI